MEKRWCSACGEAFQPQPQAPSQTYCSREECQRARKRLWQRTKRRTDHDYHENQERAQASWRRKNPDYWRRYRESHPTYTVTNRQKQKARNARRKDGAIANSDASAPWLPETGIFILTQIDDPSSGHHSQWMVHLVRLS